MKNAMIGVDLAKWVLRVRGASMRGDMNVRCKLMRDQFRAFMAQDAPAIALREACTSANYWAREMTALGHEVRLVAPQYEKLFIFGARRMPPLWLTGQVVRLRRDRHLRRVAGCSRSASCIPDRVGDRGCA